MALFTHQRREITPDDALLLLNETPSHSGWKVAQAIAWDQLTILPRELGSQDCLPLFFQIRHYLNQGLALSRHHNEGIPPYLIKQYQATAKQWGAREFRRRLACLTQREVGLRKGGDPRLHLSLLIAEFLKRRK